MWYSSRVFSFITLYAWNSDSYFTDKETEYLHDFLMAVELVSNRDGIWSKSSDCCKGGALKIMVSNYHRKS